VVAAQMLDDRRATDDATFTAGMRAQFGLDAGDAGETSGSLMELMESSKGGRDDRWQVRDDRRII
jgi:hypothetical protein